MRLLFLLFTLFMLSACMGTPEVSPSDEKSTENKIRSNQTEAEVAQSEYKVLQAQRVAQ